MLALASTGYIGRSLDLRDGDLLRRRHFLRSVKGKAKKEVSELFHEVRITFSATSEPLEAIRAASAA